MKNIRLSLIKQLAFTALIITCFLSSCKKDVKSQVEVYSNDFEKANLSNITGGVIESYNGSNVLGRYNKGSFKLMLSNLPKHSLVKINFDLYTHDSWDGNKLGIDSIDGPDIWRMLVDNNIYINTTFSNASCQQGNICEPQSYPANYPNNNNNPRNGSFSFLLPGVCGRKSDAFGTSGYRIEKTISHSGETLILECLDKLVQKNVADPKCDESWSIDNIKISVINL